MTILLAYHPVAQVFHVIETDDLATFKKTMRQVDEYDVNSLAPIVATTTHKKDLLVRNLYDYKMKDSRTGEEYSVRAHIFDALCELQEYYRISDEELLKIEDTIVVEYGRIKSTASAKKFIANTFQQIENAVGVMIPEEEKIP